MAVNKGGRPKKSLDKILFEDLCNIQCTKDEIIGVLKIDEKTLTRMCKDEYGEGFSDVYKKCASNGKKSLRRFQWDLAKRNPSMAIWLGKQYLGQREPLEESKMSVEVEDLTTLAEMLKLK